jgi:hypothetical protein
MGYNTGNLRVPRLSPGGFSLAVIGVSFAFLSKEKALLAQERNRASLFLQFINRVADASGSARRPGPHRDHKLRVSCCPDGNIAACVRQVCAGQRHFAAQSALDGEEILTNLRQGPAPVHNTEPGP